MNGLVSIIIYNKNGKRYFDPCFGAIGRQTYKDMEVVFVECGSTDDSLAYLKSKWPQFKIIDLGKDVGFAAANNAGIKASSGKYVLALNLDVIMRDDFVEEMVKAAEAHDKIGSVSGKLFSRWNTFKNVIDSTGHIMNISRRSLNRGMKEVDTTQYDDERHGRTFGVCAAAALYKKEMLEDIAVNGKYFDESFYAYLEDVDLDWRANLLGWKCHYTPKAVAFHERTGFVPGGEASLHILRCDFRNSLLMMIKNERPVNFLIDLPFYVFLTFYRYIRDLVLHPELFAQVFKVLRLLPATIGKRRQIMKKRRATDGEIRALFKRTENNINELITNITYVILIWLAFRLIGWTGVVLLYLGLLAMTCALKLLFSFGRTYTYPENKL